MDSWFTANKIDDQTFAISEYLHSFHFNFSYFLATSEYSIR